MPNNIILSNINLSAVPKFINSNKDINVNEGYNNWFQYFLSENLYHLDTYNNVFVILDGYQLAQEFSTEKDVIQLLDVIKNFCLTHKSINIYLSNINCTTPSTILYEDFDLLDSYEYFYNHNLNKNIECTPNLFLFPLKQLILKHGWECFLSDKMWYMASSTFSISGLKCIALQLQKILNSEDNVRKKCLVLDLDNTLWGGVIGEDGINGIELSDHKEGARYYDFQDILNQIKNMGAILCIASKNNYEDVEEILKSNRMLLKYDDFIVKKINWNAKSESIKEIAKELNIGLDSIVFIDDNPVERAEVTSVLPMVTVPEFPTETSDLKRFAIDIYNNYFYSNKILLEDKNKTSMYQANTKRNELKAQIPSLDDYIKTLEIVIEVSEATMDDLPRIAQMTQKTNQFNMTTKRYSEHDIAQMYSSANYMLYIGNIHDKFGDNGTSILCILELNDKSAFINTFLMSCRVMGRNIEYAFLNEIETILFEKGYEVLNACYIPTPKNIPAERFYKSANFNETSPYNYTKNIYPNNKNYLMTVIRKEQII